MKKQSSEGASTIKGQEGETHVDFWRGSYESHDGFMDLSSSVQIMEIPTHE